MSGKITALDAIRWCAKNQAVSTWVTIKGESLVVLRCREYATKNKTLQEAVSYLMMAMEGEGSKAKSRRGNARGRKRLPEPDN